MATIKIKRKIVSSTLRIKELESLKGKDVEIIINTVNAPEKSNDKQKKHTYNAAGILGQYKNIQLIEDEKAAWALAVKEKHSEYPKK